MTPLLLTAALLTAHSITEADARTACQAAPRAGRKIESVRVVSVAAVKAGDLPSLRVTHVPTGNWMSVYYDAVSERSARVWAGCLGAQLGLLDRETNGVWRGGRWFAAVFTSAPNYIPPEGSDDRRWRVTTRPNGSLDNASINFLLVVMPHEQVHAFQGRNEAVTPRWFHEGHAEWIGRKIAAIIAPQKAAAEQKERAKALQSSTTPVALAKWGGVQPRREAIMRQAPPAEQRRMEADPSYLPANGGPYSFRPGDLVSDESNTVARYEAARRIFRDLEATHGARTTGRWVARLTDTKGRVTAAQLSESARATFGDDLALRLR